ncbi:MAG: hypothetical protein K2O58_11985, partial [Bacteroidales bacterium]|nr:hypothetical protein [Bacteroidales bacterium]
QGGIGYSVGESDFKNLVSPSAYLSLAIDSSRHLECASVSEDGKEKDAQCPRNRFTPGISFREMRTSCWT